MDLVNGIVLGNRPHTTLEHTAKEPLCTVAAGALGRSATDL